MKRSKVFKFLLSLFGVFLLFFSAEKAQAIGNCFLTAESIYVSQEREGKTCYLPRSCIEKGTGVTIRFTGIATADGKSVEGSLLSIVFDSGKIGPIGDKIACLATVTADGSAECQALGIFNNNGGSYEIKAVYSSNPLFGINCALNKTSNIFFSSSCSSSQCSTEEEPSDAGWKLCTQISKAEDQISCASCMANNGVWTAIGCIPTSPQAIIKTIVTIGMSLAGVVVLILILVSAFTLSTSQGDPNKTKEAKEMLTSAIVGLLFIIFSVTILQFIGVSILNIPGFGE